MTVNLKFGNFCLPPLALRVIIKNIISVMTWVSRWPCSLLHQPQEPSLKIFQKICQVSILSGALEILIGSFFRFSAIFCFGLLPLLRLLLLQLFQTNYFWVDVKCITATDAPAWERHDRHQLQKLWCAVKYREIYQAVIGLINIV